MSSNAIQLIEQRASWKKYQEEHREKEFEELFKANQTIASDVKETVKRMQQANPLKFEFIKHLVKAHQINNQEEMEVARAALKFADQHTTSIDTRKKRK